MRSRDVLRGLTAILFCAPLLEGQTIRDRLRRVGIEVTTSTDSTQNPRTTRGTPGERTIPETSLARPELFGLVLGKTTATEAREVLSRLTPALVVSHDETRSLGVSFSTADGIKSVPLPTPTYTISLYAKAKAYVPFGEPEFGGNLSTPCANLTSERGNCELHWVVFSRPPRESVLIYYRRQITFSPRPLLTVAKESLLERMGPPSHRFESDPQGAGGLVRWTWVYGADGAQLPAGSESARGCAGQMGGLPAAPGDGLDARAAAGSMQTGCVAYLRVELSVTNGLVVTMTFAGGDLHTNRLANIAYVAQQDSVKQAYLEGERNAASKVRLPWP